MHPFLALFSARSQVLSVLGALALLPAATAPLGAQGVGSTFQISAEFDPRIANAAKVVPVLCNQKGALSGPLAGTPAITLGIPCAVPSTTGAFADVFASVYPPATFDPADPSSYELAGLRTRAIVTSEGRGFSNSDPLPPAVTATAFASFTDFLRLPTDLRLRPHSLTLSFELTGSLFIGQPLRNSGDVAEASLEYSVGAQPIYIATDGAIVAGGAAGGVTVRRRVSTSPSVIEKDTTLSNMTDFLFSETSFYNATSVTVTLNNAFFANPDADLLALNLGLFSRAYGPAWFDRAYGETASATSDFANTFAMTGLQAFDEQGNDITATAILGFQSMQPIDPGTGTVVPEPSSVALLGAGLLCLGVMVRRRRRKAVNVGSPIAMSALLVLALLPSVPTSAGAQQGSTLRTTTEVRREIGTVGSEFPPDCNKDVQISGRAAISILPLVCNIPTTTNGSAIAWASTKPTSVFDPANPTAYELAEVKTFAQVTSEWRPNYSGGDLDLQYPPMVTATSFARFTDYLLLGDISQRPFNLTLTFALTGSLFVDPLFAPSAAIAEATVRYFVEAQSGFLNGGLLFNSQEPDASGYVSYTQKVSSYAFPSPTTRSGSSSPNGAFTDVSIPKKPDTTLVTVTLNNAFFSNASNDVLLLNVGLFSTAYAQAWFNGDPTLSASVSSDFSNTFAMVGLEALDKDGKDMTDAFIRTSQGLPPRDPDTGTVVPEPSSVALLGGGLLCLAAFAQRRRRQSTRLA